MNKYFARTLAYKNRWSFFVFWFFSVSITGCLLLAVILFCIEKTTPFKSKNDINYAKTTLEYIFLPITLAIALTGSGLALMQYLEKTKADVLVTLDNKFKEFEARQSTINVREMLDGEVHYVKLFPAASDSAFRVVAVDDILLRYALSSIGRKEELDRAIQVIRTSRNPSHEQRSLNGIDQPVIVAAVIRNNFNRFLESFQQLQVAIESLPVSTADVRKYLQPWIELFRQIKDDYQEENAPERHESEHGYKTTVLFYMGLHTKQPKAALTNVQQTTRSFIEKYCEDILRENSKASNIEESSIEESSLKYLCDKDLSKDKIIFEGPHGGKDGYYFEDSIISSRVKTIIMTGGKFLYSINLIYEDQTETIVHGNPHSLHDEDTEKNQKKVDLQGRSIEQITIRLCPDKKYVAFLKIEMVEEKNHRDTYEVGNEGNTTDPKVFKFVVGQQKFELVGFCGSAGNWIDSLGVIKKKKALLN